MYLSCDTLSVHNRYLYVSAMFTSEFYLTSVGTYHVFCLHSFHACVFLLNSSTNLTDLTHLDDDCHGVFMVYFCPLVGEGFSILWSEFVHSFSRLIWRSLMFSTGHLPGSKGSGRFSCASVRVRGVCLAGNSAPFIFSVSSLL